MRNTNNVEESLRTSFDLAWAEWYATTLGGANASTAQAWSNFVDARTALDAHNLAQGRFFCAYRTPLGNMWIHCPRTAVVRDAMGYYACADHAE